MCHKDLEMRPYKIGILMEDIDDLESRFLYLQELF